MQATYKKHILEFKRPSGTSRGVLNTKETWFIKIEEAGRVGYGECGILRGLSIDDRPDYEETLKWACENIHLGEQKLYDSLEGFPSIQFGIEMAFRSLKAENPFELFPSAFTQGEKGIAINGLIWMGEASFMQEQIAEKLEAGFDCIKMKIGAIDFDTEIKLLEGIRKRYSAEEITLRVDANGAFKPEEALDKLTRLAALDLHSIEQPIRQGQEQAMAQLCKQTPLPIALDEELIGVFGYARQKELLQDIKPQYIILKPSLVGGFRGSDTWIQLAEEQGIDWWITSALESNIGLNAIAQYTFEKKTTIPQGLGTGALYTNNVSSPLDIRHGELWYDAQQNWSFQF
ncbi:o-succinylbenzoate synthase [Leeuwenhoekiella nanhaiensis]|uniref:O-succinylbenzoate synthase n=1 Tax=Leeuwenhoekiella nanhaiensis TaxID=1655491 RepID=A0A2G1VPD2_9FLAO|nr:o-succinylbenzoate synthase [Leeuwenhoekiella nanhaiensis]PHQ28604.1 o-succinylbenzoate synthase [Leeuwenhoekiella nanhaiensis]